MVTGTFLNRLLDLVLAPFPLPPTADDIFLQTEAACPLHHRAAPKRQLRKFAFNS